MRERGPGADQLGILPPLRGINAGVRLDLEGPAQAGVNAAGLGGPAEIPAELRAVALQCGAAFDSQETARVTLVRCAAQQPPLPPPGHFFTRARANEGKIGNGDEARWDS